MRRLFVMVGAGLALWSSEGRACPFCDMGGLDAAKFIMVVLVPFAAAMTLFLMAARRLARKHPGTDLSQKVFEAERSQANQLGSKDDAR